MTVTRSAKRRVLPVKPFVERWVLVCVIALTLLAASCGGDTKSGDAPNATPTTVDNGTPTTTSPPTENECDTQAKRAQLTYQPAKTMKLGETHDVDVVLRLPAASGPPPSIAGNEPTTIVPAPSKCLVRAQLYGNDFRVTPDGWQVASLLDTGTAQWSWQATPTKAGNSLPLTLELQGLLSDGTPAGEQFLHDETISVTSIPKSMWAQTRDDAYSFAKNPIVLLIASFSGLIIFVLDRRRRVEEEAASRRAKRGRAK